MNAKKTVEKMAEELINAGYQIYSFEITTTEIKYVLTTPDSQGWYVLNEMFFLSASFNERTNRWSAFLSYATHGLFTQTARKKMTYRGMLRQIGYSIKFEASQFQKVGA